MYTITTGGSDTRGSSARTGNFSRGGGSRSGGGRHGGFSSGGRGGGYRGNSAPRAFNAKRGFKKDFIDENLFINKEVAVAGIESYTPKHTFADFGIHELLAKNLIKKGLEKPSPIQDQAIPVVISGRDVIGIATTGSGKTAAFLVPLINKLVSDRDQKVMILTPTRELALQIEQQFMDLTSGMKLFSVACVGGAPIMRQLKELELGVHVVIGTPGRVKDIIERGKIKMSMFESIVLDEADRMLDMGFIDDMRDILGAMPKEKQALFFSATLPKEIERLCHDFLRDPVSISIKSRDTAASVSQDIVRASTDAEKIDALHEILNQPIATKVLIFREMKRHVDGLADELTARGFKVLALHGDMRNRERERAVRDLSTGRVQAVIATDVAARGIDIADISLVINYDIPNNYETYIHRIGRTGRGSKTGNSLTFVPRRGR
jgi:superfamily II DNA/RNA helicase